MQISIKTFNDLSESGLAIQKVTLEVGISVGTLLIFFYQSENQAAIVRSLSESGVYVHSANLLSLTIKADLLFDNEKLKIALNALKAANLISEIFVNQINVTPCHNLA